MEQLGFFFVEVYSSTIKTNATAVEKELQKQLLFLPLGVRLWVTPGMGQQHALEQGVYKVFLTFSTEVLEMLRKGTLSLKKTGRM